LGKSGKGETKEDDDDDDDDDNGARRTTRSKSRNGDYE